MTALLVASTGAAWLVIRRPQSGQGRYDPQAAPRLAETGRSILDDLRRKGLSAYWPQADTQWYLVRFRDEAIGWQVAARLPRPDGSVDGLHVWAITDEFRHLRVLWERWSLNGDATVGRYSAGTVAQDRPGRGRIATDTRIDLAAGRLKVVQTLAGVERTSTADAPPNYLPEGTFDLVRHLVAERKTRAAFRLIINDLGPDGDGTRFAQAYVGYEGESPGQAGASRRVSTWILRAGQVGRPAIHLIDEKGRVLRNTAGNLVTTAGAREDVTRHFPGAAGLYERLLRETHLSPDVPGPE